MKEEKQMNVTPQQLQQAIKDAFEASHPNSEWPCVNDGSRVAWTRAVAAAIATLPEPEPSAEIEALKEALRTTVAERDNLLKQQEALLKARERDLKIMVQPLSSDEHKIYMNFDAGARASLNHVLQLRLRNILPLASEALRIAREVNAHSNYTLCEEEVQAVLEAKARLDGVK
jgi:hypothetical protein